MSSQAPANNGRRFQPGAHPWNTGGKKGRSGRPPSKVREACRQAFSARIPTLKRIADDPQIGPAERIKAIDLLGKYGLGTTTTVTDTEGRDLPVGRLAPDEVRAEVRRILGLG